jgi:hypothetical protein
MDGRRDGSAYQALSDARQQSHRRAHCRNIGLQASIPPPISLTSLSRFNDPCRRSSAVSVESGELVSQMDLERTHTGMFDGRPRESACPRLTGLMGSAYNRNVRCHMAVCRVAPLEGLMCIAAFGLRQRSVSILQERLSIVTVAGQRTSLPQACLLDRAQARLRGQSPAVCRP